MAMLSVPLHCHKGWPGLGTSVGPTSFLLAKSCLHTRVLAKSVTLSSPAPSSAPSSVPRDQPSSPAVGTACSRPLSHFSHSVGLCFVESTDSGLGSEIVPKLQNIL